MEGLLPQTAFAQLVADKLGTQHFMLLDIGCGGGIDNAWRCFGNSLRAIAIDPNIAEIDRLHLAEKNAGVEYIAGFVGVPGDHPLAKPSAAHGYWGRNPWQRLSVQRSIELQQAATSRLSDLEKVGVNAWNQAKLARETNIYLPDLLAGRGVDDVDFIKIDVDGPDYLILQSLRESLTDHAVLGVGVEVNFCGSAHPLDNTFHNVDRFMREMGFDLFSLTTRSYSTRALPAPYLLTVPAQSQFGRPLQGDALYMRDIASPEVVDTAPPLSAERLMKLAAIYSLTGLPDCAAEILIAFRRRLEVVLDIDQALDLLVGQTKLGESKALGYREYMRLFEQNDGIFYPNGGQIEEPKAMIPSKRAKKRGWRKLFRDLKKVVRPH